jgi:hypothetical protein
MKEEKICCFETTIESQVITDRCIPKDRELFISTATGTSDTAYVGGSLRHKRLLSGASMFAQPLASSSAAFGYLICRPWLPHLPPLASSSAALGFLICRPWLPHLPPLASSSAAPGFLICRPWQSPQEDQFLK